jgi:hypothetical protein
VTRRDDVTGEWRRLHNKELYALYSSSNVIRVSSQEDLYGQDMWHVWGGERCIQGNRFRYPSCIRHSYSHVFLIILMIK